jgi:transglutaminase-like putative cysteine protease
MRFLLLILPLFLLSPGSMAQKQSFSVSPAPDWLAPYQPDLSKKPDEREVSDGYYLLLMEEQHQAEKNALYRHIIRQIVSEAGIQNGAEISIDYDPTYEKLRFHQLLIRRNGQVINKLNGARFRFLQKEEDLARFIYSGTYTAWYILEDVRKGDQIEYAYTLEGGNPIFDHKYANSFYFTSYDPIVNYYKALITAPGRDIQFKPFNGARLPAKSTWKGMQLYEWKIADILPKEEADNTPDWYTTLPFVQASEYRSWQEIIDWGAKINTPPTPGAKLLAKIAELKKLSGNDKSVYLQQATRFVQDDIRYMGIEMGEYSHRPNNPDKIISQRFGDCKDKSLLLTTLLQAEGISASMAYTNTYLKSHVSDYLPSPFMFNHVIVCAQLGDSNIWIDPTISYQRGPLSQHTIPDYQEALIIKPGGSNQLTAIPQQHIGKIKVVEQFEMPDSRQKKGTLTVASIYSLQFADELRDVFANNSMKDQEKNYLEYYKNVYGDLHADSALRTVDDPAKNQFCVIEHYALEEPWKADTTEPGKLIVPVTAGIIQEALPAAGKKGNAPLAMRYPYSLEYTIRMEMPVEWSFDDEPFRIKNKYYAFSFTPKVDGKHVSFHYTFETFQDHIPADFKAQYEKDRSRMDDAISFNLFWTPDNPEAMAAPPHKGVNWVTLMLGIFFLAFFSWVAWQYSLRSIHPVQSTLEPAGINGPISLIALLLLITSVSFFSDLYQGDYFSNSAWQQLGKSTDIIGNTSVLQCWQILRMVASIFFLIYSVLLIVLLLRRRDTFPDAMVYYLLIILLFGVFNQGISHIVYTGLTWGIHDVMAILPLFLKGVIITPYLRQSQRVKAIFIMPHKSLRS